jgi:hypothetical protein
VVGSARLYWDGWESTKKGFIHVASFFHRGLTLDLDYRAFDQGYRVEQRRYFVSVVSYDPALVLALIWARRPERRERDQRLIHAPWAVVLSQTRSHSSLSVFSAVAKRKLTGLVLRRLWMLDMDWRLLWGEAITKHLEPQMSGLLVSLLESRRPETGFQQTNDSKKDGEICGVWRGPG